MLDDDWKANTYRQFQRVLESGIAITACKTFLNNTLNSLQKKKKKVLEVELLVL